MKTPLIQIGLVVLALIFFVLLKSDISQSRLPKITQINALSLTDQNHNKVTHKDLRGSVWVADFIFTTCSGICPMMSKNMSALANTVQGKADVRMVSITVNPENDTPDVLKSYGKKYNANHNWLFLTGPREHIQDLAVKDFKIGDMKEIVFHSSMFVLVDRYGWVRGYYDANDSQRLQDLKRDVQLLRKEITLPLLPTTNALLNTLCFVFLLLGFIAIKKGEKALHQRFMVMALLSSAAFLSSYVYYHLTTSLTTKYQGVGLSKALYLSILLTHTVLAMVIVPFVLMAVFFAWKGNFDKHVRITRWLFPTWAYVSVTGVVVYLMLYVFRPA